jgi:hypothetical protein
VSAGVDDVNAVAFRQATDNGSARAHPAVARGGQGWRPRWWFSPQLWAGLCAAAAALARLPFLTMPLAPDEGGVLLVASQWSPGTSLYGNYWVDRPPLLIGLFQIADLGGGAVALRLLGTAAVVASVLLAGRVGRALAPFSGRAYVLCAATAAVFLSTPLFGATEVNGELLALPFVLAGFLAGSRALTEPRRPRALGWWAAAGVAGAAAALVKQNMLEVFVFTAVSVAWLLGRRRVGPAAAVRSLAAFGLGAGALVGCVVGWAWGRGTDPAPLWNAVVSFRAAAASVISASADAATPHRAQLLALSFAASGAIAVVVAALVPGRHSTGERRPLETGQQPVDVRWVACGVSAWEVFAVAAGGSYWLHYLVATVPALVLIVASICSRKPRRIRWVVASLVYGAVVATAALFWAAPHESGADAAVEQYLLSHERPGDTGVVAFGDPAILETAHLPSPYPQLWSLPVRVLDPHLVAFTRTLKGPDRPTWVVVNGTTLTTWGVDASKAQPVLDRDYRRVKAEGNYVIYRLQAPLSEPVGE